MKTDSELKKDVGSELLWDPLIPEARVGVAVNEGVVTLTGHLDTYAEKIAVKRAVERVSGVKAIAVELNVIPSGIHQRSVMESPFLQTQLDQAVQDFPTLFGRSHLRSPSRSSPAAGSPAFSASSTV